VRSAEKPVTQVEPRPGVFTPRFFLMCGFTFTVFLSLFMLLPTVPFRILDVGGTKLTAGLFLGFLTYSSALSAPITGALADRVGKRLMLIVSSLAIAGFSTAYGLSQDSSALLGLVLFHGVFWSGLLGAAAAYMTDILPENRRAEGISYWGIATILAIAVAPPVGLWLYDLGWTTLCAVAAVLNLGMATIAWNLDEPSAVTWSRGQRLLSGSFVEWNVLVTSFTLFLCSFGYGGITSFVVLYADAHGVEPRGIYFMTFATAMIFTRPVLGPLADRLGHKKVFMPCVALVVVGEGLLWMGGTRPWLVASAIVFGAGFGSLYPIFMAHVMKRVPPTRRGAAFGGILAAFDTGIGTGSIVMGWLIERNGFGHAFGTATILASCALPYFLFAEPRFLAPRRGQEESGSVADPV
jgi:MFS family permease